MLPGRVTTHEFEVGELVGVRIRKSDLERAGLVPAPDAVVKISLQGKVVLSHVRFVDGGKPADSVRHYGLQAQARAERLKKRLE